MWVCESWYTSPVVYGSVIQSGMLSRALRFGLDEDSHSAIDAPAALHPAGDVSPRRAPGETACALLSTWREQPGSEFDGHRLLVRIASHRIKAAWRMHRFSGRRRSKPCPPVVLAQDLEQLQSNIDEALCLVYVTELAAA